jgi:hypothetical protein
MFGADGNSKSYRRLDKYLMSYIRQLFLSIKTMCYRLYFSLQNIISHIEKIYCTAAGVNFAL